MQNHGTERHATSPDEITLCGTQHTVTVDQRHTLHGDVAPVLLWQKLDHRIPGQHLHRFDLEQGDLPSFLRLVRIEAGLPADHVSVAHDSLSSDEGDFVERLHRKEGAGSDVQEAHDALPCRRDIVIAGQDMRRGRMEHRNPFANRPKGRSSPDKDTCVL